MMDNVEKTKRDWESFFHKLKGAIALAGGSAGYEWARMPLEEVYKALHPNGVHLLFTLSRDLRERILGEQGD